MTTPSKRTIKVDGTTIGFIDMTTLTFVPADDVKVARPAFIMPRPPTAPFTPEQVAALERDLRRQVRGVCKALGVTVKFTNHGLVESSKGKVKQVQIEVDCPTGRQFSDGIHYFERWSDDYTNGLVGALRDLLDLLDGEKLVPCTAECACGFDLDA